MPGTLFVVATPIGNLEDITARALRTLRDVAVVAAEDTRRTRQLLSHFGISTPTTSLHEHNEHAKLGSLIRQLQDGASVALVSDAGTPLVSDPGRQLVSAAIAAGIRVEPIPGPSAMTAIIMASDLISGGFTYVGFAPNRSNELISWVRRLALAGQTVVFFEAPHRIAATLRRILDEAGDIQLCVGRELTKVHEQFLRGSVSEVLAALGEPRGEFTVIAAFPPPSSSSASTPPTAAELRTEIGRITESSGLKGRAAMAEAGRKFGLATNAVYDLLKGAGDSGD